MVQRIKVRYYVVVGFPAFGLSSEGEDAWEFLYFSMGKHLNMCGLEQAGTFYKNYERVF